MNPVANPLAIGAAPAVQLPPTSSFSSLLIGKFTLLRNQGGWLNTKQIGAQIGYAIVCLVAVAETVMAVFAYAFGTAVYWCEGNTDKPDEFLLQLSNNKLLVVGRWLESSSFCILWSVVDFTLNLAPIRLVADEASARTIAFGGNFMMVPPGAVF